MKKMTMRMAAWLMILLSVTTVAFAANPNRVGTAGAQELNIPVGARGIAIGGSYFVFAKGVDALYYNPAGLASLPGSVEALVSNMDYIADINVVYGALGVKVGEFGNIGFSLKSINFGKIPVTTTDFPDGTGQNYSPTYITLTGAYAKALTDRISVGFSASLVSERIMELSASGVVFNIGIQYSNLAVQGLNLAVTVKNIGSSMTFNGSNLLTSATAATGLRGPQTYSLDAASFDMPSALEIGFGYKRNLDEKNAVTLSGLFRNNNYLDDEYNVGAEYSFNDLLFLRGGYAFAPQAAKDPTGANSYIYDYTFGLGLHYPVGDVDLSVDYAYRHMKYFTGNNVFSLRIGF